MKKEVLKHLKKKTRENIGPVPPTKIEPSEKDFKRKPKHPKKDSFQED